MNKIDRRAALYAMIGIILFNESTSHVIIYLLGLAILALPHKDNTLSFYSLHNDTPAIKKATKYSAGWDICNTRSIKLQPRSRVLVSTDVYIRKLPRSTYIRIAPRSGWALKGVDVAAGVVDADYGGEIRVLLVNTSDLEITVYAHSRIAQLIPEKYLNGELKWNGLPWQDTDYASRGVDGFGSTGV